jgi:YD repeat-containing protein
MQPSLAIAYSSASRGDDITLIGAGWDLIGLGYIERSTKNGVPKYDSSDSYVLVLNRASNDLVYSSSDLRYHTKQETFFRIELVSPYWIVTDTKGTQYFFGYTAEARAQAADRGNVVRRWSLDRVRDTHGNEMLIKYHDSTFDNNGGVYPEKITYTLNTGLAVYRKVEFHYESKPDQPKSYRYGTPITMTKRLAYIDVKMNGDDNTLPYDMIRRYELTYADSTDSKESLLVNVREFGADADPNTLHTGTSFPPTTFTYEVGGNSFAPGGANPWFSQTSDNNGGWLGDFDGDGRTDILLCNSGTLYVLKSMGSTFIKKDWLTQTCDTDAATPGSQLSLGVHDFDGDGKDDIDIWDPSTNQLKIYRSTGSSFQFAWSWTPSPNIAKGYFGDFNADGKTDLLYLALYSNCSNLGISGDCVSWEVRLSTGVSFGGASSWYAYSDSPQTGFETLWANVVDLIGDGKTDLILHLKENSTGVKGIFVGLSTGINFNGANSGWWLSPSPAESESNWRFGDFNGDGLTDLMVLNLTDTNQNQVMDALDAKVYLLKGNGFAPNTIWLSEANSTWYSNSIYLADFNGDGKTDLLGLHTYPSLFWQVYLSSGAGDLNAPGSGQWATAASGPYATFIEDLDGDGKIDLGEYWDTSGDINLFLSSGPPVDLLKTITNSLGGMTTNGYISSGKAESCASNPQYLPMKLQTVCSVIQNDGLGNSFATTYLYEGGKYDPTSREFRGFSRVKAVDPTGAYNKTFFLQTNELKGRPSQVESFGPDDALYSRTLKTWDYFPISGATGVIFPFLKQEDGYIFDATTTAKHTQVRYKYDCNVSTTCYGNLIETYQLGDLDVSWDDRRIVNSFFPNTGSYIVSLPSQSTTLNSSGARIAESYNYYDGSTQFYTPPVKGDLTKVCRWLNSGSGTSNSCTNFLYDDFGNRTRVTDANNNPFNVAYDSTYKTFPITETNARNQVVAKTYWKVSGANTSLTPITGSYAVPGMLATVTDPNNVRTDSYWDALGRPHATVVPPDTSVAPTSVTTYNQSGTAPSSVLVQTRQSPTGGTLDAYSFVDGFGRTIQTKTPAPDGTNQIVKDTKYNSRGLAETVSVPYLKPTSTAYSVPDTTVKKMTTLYDPLRRVSQITNTDGTYSSILYDKWTTTQIDPNGHKKVETRDAFGRLVQVDEYTGADGRNAPTYPASVYTLYATTSYDYDGFDPLGNNIQTIVDALGNKTTVIFDSLGRKVFMHDPDMGDWRYSYDLVGNLLKQGDPKKQIVSFTYDNLNRVLTKTSSLDTTAPFTQPGLSAVAVSNTQINLGWNDASDTVGVSGYWIERCQGVGCSSTPSNFSRINSFLMTTSDFIDTGLTSGTSYSYRVQAVDLAGNLGGYSNVATASTKSDPVLTVTKSGTGAGTVTSTPARIDCGTTCSASFNSGSSVTLTATRDVGSTFAGWSGACTGTGACTVTMNAAKSVTATFNDNQPPTAPEVLTATASSDTQIVLLWTVSSDNVGVDHYEVERSPNKTSYSSIGSPTVNQLTHTATSGVTYLYRVRAVDAAGNASAYSNVDLATAIIFADDPIVAASTTVKADHFIKLRDAVNAVRTAAALPSFNWSTTDSLGNSVLPPAPGNPVKAQHVIDLRNNLIPGLNLLGFPIPSYTDPSLTTGAGGTLIKKDHIQQLRQGVK